METGGQDDNGRSWWEGRYRRGDTGWDQGRAAPGVEAAAGFFPPGARVLVPGCGFGHDAAALAAKGFQVEGWDVAPSAVRRARERHVRPGLVFRERDFFAPDGDDAPFDAIFEHTFLCAVGPAFYEAAAARFARLLRPGGLVFAVLFTDLTEEDPPPWRIAPATVRAVFGRFFTLLPSEPAPVSFPHRRGEESFWRMRKKTGSL